LKGAFMNQMNAMRYSLSKLKKYFKHKEGKDFREVASTFHEIPMPPFHNMDYCAGCICDDFGYCGLRHGKKSDNEIFDVYCCSQMIKTLEQRITKRRQHDS